VIFITVDVACAADFTANPQVLSNALAPDFPGPRYSVLQAAGTLVFRAGMKSKRNFTFRKQYFSHHWALGENACI
jgi:hypothetical protein